MTADNNSVSENTIVNGLEIAVIGMDGRFPGADTIDELWEMLKSGVEAISFFSEEDLLASGENPTLLKMPNYVKARPVLSDVEYFDAAFFGFLPREAQIIDPQHRLFLECAWHALEHAGYNAELYEDLIGVFAGTTLSTYLISNLLENQQAHSALDSWQIGIGNEKDSLPTRVSHLFDLRGPSINVQSACSTSLVAIHLACQSLLNYECDMALAGGISIRVPQNLGYLGQAGLLSTDGHCRPFDANASGMITGDGVGVVVLKRLTDAIADRDHIHAIIKGSAVNNDGALKVGYTAPGLRGQEAVIVAAQAIADVDVETISYIEAHGTGTPLGDSIEVAALTQAFQPKTTKKQFCALGSIKSNIGHLDNAAGVAGFIKTVLALKNKQIPPSLNFEQLNPEIELTQSPFYINTDLQAWESNGVPRRAGVSAFGIGGTNAHVILEEAPSLPSLVSSRPWQLLTLSAKTDLALEAAVQKLAAHLKEHPAQSLADVAYTLHLGRKDFDYRCILVCRHQQDAQKSLKMRIPTRVFTTHLNYASRPSLVFLFPGVGDHYVDMSLGLYQSEPTFRGWIDRSAEFLLPILDMDFRELLYRGIRSQDAAENPTTIDFRAMLGQKSNSLNELPIELKQTAFIQPIVFAVEYALAQLLLEWGLQPDAMIGHSLGEYVAACLGGVFSWEDALTIVAKRAQLINQLPSGKMLAVTLTEEEIHPFLSDDLSLAIVNGPSNCVLSGVSRRLEQFEEQMTELGISCRWLSTSHAFHSNMMEPASEQFRQIMAEVTINPTRIPYISNVTGDWITPDEVTNPDYWTRHMCQTVRFGDGLAQFLHEKAHCFVEVGPGQSLSAFIKLHPDYRMVAGQKVLATLPSVHEKQPDEYFLLNTLGELWLTGIPVNWKGFYAHEQRQRVPLPTYAFDRQRYWVDPDKQITAYPHSISQKEKPDIADLFYLPVWRQTPPSQFLNYDKIVDESTCCLIFSNNSKSCTTIGKRLGQECEVVTVKEGNGYLKISENEFTIHPSQLEDYEAMFEALHASNRVPNIIVHAWSISTDIDNVPYASEKMQDITFYSILYLVQALDKSFASHSIHLKIISDEIFQITGEELVFPEKATLLGACQSISVEYTNIQCQVIDFIPTGQSGRPLEGHISNNTIAEIKAASLEGWVAYRGEQRWCQAFEAIKIPQQGNMPISLLRDGGTYMIVGGLGSIGLALAQSLAETVSSVNLVLINRSGLPERESWSVWLAEHDEQDIISNKIKKVQLLEELGANVLMMNADITDQQQMREVKQYVEQELGSIHGLIHSAGIYQGSLITLKQREEAGRILAPKVKGLRVIENLFENSPLEFLVLCSSAHSFFPRIGQLDHSASFNFMDAFAYYYTHKFGTPTISIDWPAWQELGLAAMTEIPFDKEVIRQFAGEHGLSSSEGAEAFKRILSAELRQVIVSAQDMVSLFNQFRNLSKDNWGDLLKETLPSINGVHSRPTLKSVYVPPGDDIEKSITSIWENLLGIEGVGIHDSLIELGGHSLLALQIISRLKDRYDLEIPVRVLFENPTIASLANYIKASQRTQANYPDDDERDVGVI